MYMYARLNICSNNESYNEVLTIQDKQPNVKYNFLLPATKVRPFLSLTLTLTLNLTLTINPNPNHNPNPNPKPYAEVHI